MTDKSEIPVFPIASWQIGPVLIHGIVTFCPNFLDEQNQNPDKPTLGRYYGMSPAQVRHLIADLQKALDELEMYESQDPTKLNH